ncbi:MAG: hypothetical protein RX318_03775 [bacterium]|nr:hypothetical protein [bacterium]
MTLDLEAIRERHDKTQSTNDEAHREMAGGALDELRLRVKQAKADIPALIGAVKRLKGFLAHYLIYLASYDDACPVCKEAKQAALESAEEPSG